MNDLTTPLSQPTSLAPAVVAERRENSQAESEGWDIIVVGAGPAGALAARQLANMGRKTLLIDKCEFPRPKVCGGCLNGDAVATLHDLGLGHLVSDPYAIVIDRFQLAYDSTQICWNTPTGAAISRTALDAALVTEATSAGATFLSGTRATVGDRIPDSPFREVLLHSIQGHIGAARGRVVIVADGLHQMSIRGREELRSAISPRTRIGIGATLPADCSPLEPGTIRMTIHADGYVGVVRIPGDQITVAAAVDAGALHRRSPAELIERLFGRQPLSPRFRAALHEVEWRGTGPLTRTCRTVATDDILLVGDASGYVEPFTGEGMAWSFRTAVAAAELIERSLQARDECCSGESNSAMQDPATATLAHNWVTAHREMVGTARRRCHAITWAVRHTRLTRSLMRFLHTFPGLAEPLIQSVFAARNTTLFSDRTVGLWRARPKRPLDPAASHYR